MPLQFERVCMTYPAPGGRTVTAIADLNLEIRRGEFLVLAGPSGSGKTTLLRLASGLEEPASGTVRLGNALVTSIPARERPIAMVFQSPALFPEMTVAENIGFGLHMRRMPAKEIRARIGEAAEVLGVANLLRRKPGNLSGGERQRVALGRALVRRPEILLLDEPLASLDPQLRLELRTLIRDLHARIGSATVCVTHDHDEAMLMADRLAILRAGRLEQLGSPDAIYGQPASLFVAGFFGSPPINLLPGVLHTSSGTACFRERSGTFTLQLPAGSPRPEGSQEIILGLRPEGILLDAAPASAEQPGPGQFAATVESVASTGPETFVSLRCGANLLRARAGPFSSPEKGGTVRFTLNPSRVLLFDPATGRLLA